MEHKWRRRLFWFTMKSPLAVILVLMAILGSLYLIGRWSSVDAYLKVNGVVRLDEGEAESMKCIEIRVNSVGRDAIQQGTAVFWYVEPTGARYRTTFKQTGANLQQLSGKGEGKFRAWIPVGNEGEGVLAGQTVQVEIFLGKRNLIDELWERR